MHIEIRIWPNPQKRTEKEPDYQGFLVVDNKPNQYRVIGYNRIRESGEDYIYIKTKDEV